jgi:hypothetical protein
MNPFETLLSLKEEEILSLKEDGLPALGFVGRFFQKVSYENILVAVRSQIQTDRLIKFGIDEHPDWEELLNKITNKYTR